MFLTVIILIAGLLLILVGANILINGASAIAKRLNVSGLVIGLTIVAFGTSAPELTISIVSAFSGGSDIALGNVVGSNLFNTLMITGCVAIIAPIVVSKGTLSKEIPLCVLGSLVLFFLANDQLIDQDSVNNLSRIDGLILLCFFCIFLGYTFSMAKKGSSKTETLKSLDMALWRSLVYILGGFVGLVYGGQLFVDSASNLARLLGVKESIIGLTLVAGGTSLPELATSVVAALKKNPEMAVGNVIGSNLFNIFLVLGCSASISPMPVKGITNVDLGGVVLSSILLFFVSFLYRNRTITRPEGILLVACYVGYTVFLISQV